MNNKFTPGPWAALQEECDKPYVRIRGTMLGGRYKIANVLAPVYDGVHAREAVETRANAHLIAAAPDMYAALKAVSEMQAANRGCGMETHMELDDLMPQIRAALAKATP